MVERTKIRTDLEEMSSARDRLVMALVVARSEIDGMSDRLESISAKSDDEASAPGELDDDQGSVEVAELVAALDGSAASESTATVEEEVIDLTDDAESDASPADDASDNKPTDDQSAARPKSGGTAKKTTKSRSRKNNRRKNAKARNGAKKAAAQSSKTAPASTTTSDSGATATAVAEADQVVADGGRGIRCRSDRNRHRRRCG